MKAVLNVDGKRLEVTSISFYQGEITNVSAYDANGEMSIYYDENASWTPPDTKRIDLDVTLEYPSIDKAVADKWTKLIEHLEEVIVDENNVLTDVAINAMEGNSLPFAELSLIESQKEYKLMQQRVLGVIDTVEEVKAFMEGWYVDDVNDDAAEAEISH